MNPEIKNKWLEALRSGRYKQGTNVLQTVNGEFCCLGVLCDLHNKEFDTEWVISEYGELSYEGHVSYLPNHVAKWAYLDYGYYEDSPTIMLANMNDGGSSFKEIASYIEETL